jgi:asparagine synthase (glutamine-hydrolysing)
LFFGYPSWARAARLQRLDRLPVPRLAKSLGVRALGAVGRGTGMAAEWLRRGAAGQPVFWSGAESFGDGLKKSVLADPLRRRFAGESSWSVIEPLRRDFAASNIEQSDSAWMAYTDLRLRLPELLLMRLDKMSMGVSLEARVPFLDHRLVEVALGIPESIKLGGPGARGELKPVLKRAVRGLVPDALIDRPKQGFGVPVHEWFRTRLGERMTTAVRTFAETSGLLDRDAVEALLARPERAPQAWVLTNLALWHERAIAGA